MNPFNPPGQEGRRQPHQIDTNLNQGNPVAPLPRNNSNGPIYGEPPGGSFAAYAAAESANNRNSGGNGGNPDGRLQRPGMGPVQVSFQEPKPRGHSGASGNGRSGPSRESIKKDPYSDRRSSAGETSMLPELRRSSSNFANNNQLGGGGVDSELGGGFSNSNFKRKKSLVRPDRERMDPSHRQWYYRNHAAQMDSYDANGEGGARRQRVDYMPSTTGHLPRHGAAPQGMGMASMAGPGGGLSGLGVSGPISGYGQEGHYLGEAPNMPPGGLGRAPGGAGGLRRGRSILARDEDAVESGINFLKRGMSLRRSKSQNAGSRTSKETMREVDEGSRVSRIAPGPVGPWMIYCYVLTICCPGPFLSCFGIRTPEQQRAWREKMGLISIIGLCMAAVGFLTFGFTQAVCPAPPTRYVSGKIDVGSMTFDGYDYDFDNFYHPQVAPFDANGIYNHTNPIYSEPWSSGGQDATLLFQKVGGFCTNIITSKTNAAIDTYYPCQLTKQDGTPGYAVKTPSMCHPSATINDFYTSAAFQGRRRGQVYFTWDQVTNPARNLGVWKGSVLDYGRLSLLDNTLNYPALFNNLKTRNETWAGKDATAGVMRSKLDGTFDCLEQITRVGFIDSESIGCIASKVELYLALVIIIGVVAIKFLMAVIFGWFLSWRLGNYANETYEQRMKRAEEIEKWSEDIYRPAPAGYRPNAAKRKSFFPTTSRFSQSANTMLAAPKGGRGLSEKAAFANAAANGKRNTRLGVGSPLDTPPGSPSLSGIRSSASLAAGGGNKSNEVSSYGGHGSRRSSFSNDLNSSSGLGPCPFPLHNIVPQPSSDWQPFNFPLAYSICLVTAYSESFEGLRTTLDSLATTDYPNSHKLILVIADGIVKGAGSDISTPDICLSMMKDLVVPAEEVEGNSYVAIADGYKRHNMAKVYAGFYEYDDDTVERSKQQRVPMILVAKCGSPLEADSAKPGNRGKRDSQVMLMAFMQKVMFDERMTTFEYEFFNSIWRVTGVSPDHYEIVLMVDADTKVFPDSLTRMVSCMVEDPEIMGLCGETKIANKAETWVTMIQVFEYYISHHQTKAFEACFGGVTCLPGCFSAYRIKAPKGPNGYWVPILANPDIVEHYSENVVDTLHKKNLLLLGEDRYLTTLMLKTFPKRKMMFVPQAVCKTIVPDTFRILLSQRRRWINSTVHNLSELIMVNDLCGTFCFSMRFVIFMELAGTLVLPAAIAFTLYVVVSSIVGRPQVIPLVLLGIILGLPGLLIVVTSRKIAYLGWMLVYLVSLPIWNFVLPAYAFWHMDDFSWGATRIVQGDKKESGHGDADGKFDPSDIVMKRWADFERERRWRSGTHSRDSTYDVVQRTGSPDRAGSTRYSVVSSDTYHSNPSTAQHEAMYGRGGLLSGAAAHGQESSDQGHARAASGSARARLDSVPLLELPAPLGPNAAGGQPKSTAPGSVTVARPRESSPAASSNQHSSNATHSQYGERYGLPVGIGEYQEEENRPMMSSGASSPDPENRVPPFAIPTPRSHPSLQPQSGSDLRHGSVSSEQRYPGVSEAAFTQTAFTAEPEDAGAFSSGPIANQQQPPQRRPTREQPPNAQLSRGFSLVDDGPVASPQGVRQITRGARRMSAQSPVSPQSTGNARRGHNNADSLPSNTFLDNHPR